MHLPFSLWRRRSEVARTEPPLLPAPSEDETGTTPFSTNAIAIAGMATSTLPFDKAVAAMLDSLDDYLPPPVASLPEPSMSIVSLQERSTGLGNRRGTESRAGFPVVALLGIRLDGMVRFQLSASTPSEAEIAANELAARLLADRDSLWSNGFLRLLLKSSAPAEHVSALNAWRKQADYEVLYEHRYQDNDGAESLIARIPIHSDLEIRNSPERDTTVVSDEMVRWDNEAAPLLAIRGPFNVGSLSVLAFIPGTAPVGMVTVKRTFDGAAGPLASHLTWPAFLAAVAGPNAPERHAQKTFPSLTDFLAEFVEEPTFVTAEEHLGSEPAPITLRRNPVVKSARNRISLHVALAADTRSLKVLYDGDPAPGAGEVKVDRATGQMTFSDAVTPADKVTASYVTVAGDPVVLGDWNLV